MSFYRPTISQRSCRSPKPQTKTSSNFAKPQKSVAFQENSALGDSISTNYDRLNYGNSPSLYDNPNKSCCSLLSSPKKTSISTRETPKNIVKNVINRTSGGYVDEDYPETVDQLLEDGFSIVSERKNEKEFLLAQRDALEAQIAQAGKDMLPELRRGKFLKEALMEARGMRSKYLDDIHYVEVEIKKIKSAIESKKTENMSKERELEATIYKLHGEIEEVSGDIETRRDADKQEITKLEKKLVVTKEQQKGLNGEIGDLKKQLGHMRAYSLARTRMLENKSNTYVGMLHHKGL